MSYLIGQPIEVLPGIYYTIVAQHRYKVNSNKSRWTIPLPEEVSCFEFSARNSWQHAGREEHDEELNQQVGWGFIQKNSKFSVIGENQKLSDLKIAKFLGDTNNSWHGFPADYRNRIQDRPPMNVLEAWVNGTYLPQTPKTIIYKIRRGQKCNF